MPISFRSKLKKLEYESKISKEELNEFLNKLDGHDRELYNKAIDDFKSYLLNHKRLVRDFKTKDLYEAVKLEFISLTDAEEVKVCWKND